MPRRIPRFILWLGAALVALAVVAYARTLLVQGDPEAFAARPADAVVVDVRTAGEFEAGHVEGAIHAHLTDAAFESRMAALDRERPVYVYGANAAQGARAASVLERLGFRHVVHAGRFADLAASSAAAGPAPSVP